jgi:hypothetical protein
MGRLTTLEVAKIAEAGRYADGGGLYLIVRPARSGGFARSCDPPPMAGPLPVLVDGWRFDQFVLV